LVPAWEELVLAQKNSVSPQYLLQGATYALEQCGLLLRDANLLYENGSYASAVALALFAQEELGRWKMLRDLRRKVLDGERITIGEIQARCADHVSKQKAGIMSTVLRADNQSGLGKLLQARANSIPSSDAWKAADEQIKKLDRQKAKRVPSDRHDQRMSALYVDAVAPDQWNRPIKEISRTSVFEYLQDVANDYSIQHDHYINPEIYKPDDPEFYTALEELTDRPILPSPERPPLSVEHRSLADLRWWVLAGIAVVLVVGYLVFRVAA
jgi:AbiV family abortive infection protein